MADDTPRDPAEFLQGLTPEQRTALLVTLSADLLRAVPSVMERYGMTPAETRAREARVADLERQIELVKASMPEGAS